MKTLWLIKDREPTNPNWPHWAAEWSTLIETNGRYRTVTPHVVTLEDMTARDYQDSNHLDLDQLSSRS